MAGLTPPLLACINQGEGRGEENGRGRKRAYGPLRIAILLLLIAQKRFKLQAKATKVYLLKVHLADALSV